jgi:hypothetical protein
MSIEAMKQALDCLQAAYNLQQIDDLIPAHAPVKQAVAALRQAIEQAEKRTTEFSAQTKRNIEFMKQFENKENQEPMELPAIKFAQVADGIEVGYDLFGGVDIRLGGEFVYVHINYDYKYTDNATRTLLANDIVRLLTTPQPQREWVGLTDEEIAEAIGDSIDDVYFSDFRKVIAKLKEKNT